MVKEVVFNVGDNGSIPEGCHIGIEKIKLISTTQQHSLAACLMSCYCPNAFSSLDGIQHVCATVRCAKALPM